MQDRLGNEIRQGDTVAMLDYVFVASSVPRSVLQIGTVVGVAEFAIQVRLSKPTKDDPEHRVLTSTSDTVVCETPPKPGPWTK